MITGDGIPGNANTNSLNITMNIGWLLLIIFLIVGVAIFIAFICYHAKDKKIEQLKKLIKEQPTDKEIQLIIEYRKLSNNNQKVIDNAVKDLNDDTTYNRNTPFTKE